MHTDEQLLTIDEASALLRLAPSSLRRRIVQGDIAAVKIGGSGRLLFRRADLESALRYVRPDDERNDG